MIRMSETESEECYGQRKTGGSRCEVVCEFFVSSLGRVVGTEAGELKNHAKKDGLKDAVLTVPLE